MPRLKIADRCSFADRFLVVRGDKRTYKIHLGSGNILMEPNDQYLCIVPDSRSRARQDDLFLPFEGDSTLSIIISKALLLADDTKIKDPTITRQIDGAMNRRITRRRAMPVTLTIRDETTSGDVYGERPLEFPTERITVRDLIRERVYQEVQDFNRQRRASGSSAAWCSRRMRSAS